MTIVDFNSTYQAATLEQLETILMKRYENGLNHFWLSHDGQDYPTLTLMIKGDLAAMHYMPAEDNAGFRSLGALPQLPKGGATTFSISTYHADDVAVPNDGVVETATAIAVAREFFGYKDLPQSIKWEAL